MKQRRIARNHLYAGGSCWPSNFGLVTSEPGSRDNFFVHLDQEGWRDDSTLYNSGSKHIFQNVHNFVNNLVQFSAQIVFNCEARRLDPFVGSAYKNTNIFHQRYSMVQQTGPARNG